MCMLCEICRESTAGIEIIGQFARISLCKDCHAERIEEWRQRFVFKDKEFRLVNGF